MLTFYITMILEFNNDLHKMDTFIMYILTHEGTLLFCFLSRDNGLDVLLQGVIRPFGFVDLVERLAPHPRSHPSLNDIHFSHSKLMNSATSLGTPWRAPLITHFLGGDN